MHHTNPNPADRRLGPLRVNGRQHLCVVPVGGLFAGELVLFGQTAREVVQAEEVVRAWQDKHG